MGHAAFRTTSPEAVDRRARSLKDANVDISWTEDEFGYGKTLQFESPDGHHLSLVWEAEKYQAPPELASKILTRPSKKPLQGLPVKRIDHLNVMASDVTPVKETFERHLGFQTRERVVDGDVEIGAWIDTNILGHEVACMRDTLGEQGRFHHVAMFYGIPQHNIDAAEMFREYEIQIECGPDKHGITQGSFLYVFEPGGNRIELFGDVGVLQFEPDYQTRTWQMSDIDTGLAIGGAKLPFETYFTYQFQQAHPDRPYRPVLQPARPACAGGGGIGPRRHRALTAGLRRSRSVTHEVGRLCGRPTSRTDPRCYPAGLASASRLPTDHRDDMKGR